MAIVGTDPWHAALDLPGHVRLAALWSADVPPSLATAPMPPALRSVATARRSSFLRGRHCAASALAALGCDAPAILPISPEGLPVWPPGTIGSIGHSDAAAVAIVAPRAACGWLGIDLEPLASTAHAADIAAAIATDAELAAMAGLPRALATIVAFCAKEAAYKALLPGRFLDFDAARIRRADGSRLELELACDWAPTFPAGTIVPICWTIASEHVVAVAVGPPPPG